VLQSQRLRDKSAHRPSHDTCTLETECLDYVRAIIRELRDIEWISVVGRATDPAVVEEDELVGRREPMDERRIPVGARRSEPVQKQKRAAISNSAINDLRAIDLDRRCRISFHRTNSTIEASRHLAESVNPQMVNSRSTEQPAWQRNPIFEFFASLKLAGVLLR
jgi:hypothetical protein